MLFTHGGMFVGCVVDGGWRTRDHRGWVAVSDPVRGPYLFAWLEYGHSFVMVCPD